jgi:hypothetical protein
VQAIEMADHRRPAEADPDRPVDAPSGLQV